NAGYTINDAVTINGPGVLNPTLNGATNGGARIMTVDHTAARDDGTGSFNPATPITVVINNLTFAGAATTTLLDGAGGALRNIGDNVTLQATDFENNSDTLADDGAVRSNGGTLTIRQSSFVNNSSAFSGGAVGFSGGTGTVENSTFTGNKTTGAGGGGAIDIFDGATVTVANNTISGNSTATAT